MSTLRFITDTGDPARQTLYVGYTNTQTKALAGQVRNDRMLAYTVEPVYRNAAGSFPLLLPDFNPATDTFQVSIGVPDTEATGGTFGLGILAATITASSVANPTSISTTAPHLLLTGDTVYITGHTGSTPAVSGAYTITKTGASTFTIPVNVTVGGTGGSIYFTKSMTALAYNVSAATLQTAFSADMVQLGYAACTVTVDTDDTAPFLSFTISANANGAIPSGLFYTAAGNLFPQCDVTINEVDLGDADNPYRLILVVRQAPVALSVPATALPSTGVTATVTQALSATTNEIITITFDNVDPVSGTFFLTATAFGLARTFTIPWDMSASDLSDLLETHIYLEGNVSVTKSGSAFIIELINSQAARRILSSTLANPSVITTDGDHGFPNGLSVTHSGTNSTPVTDGAQTALVTGDDTYTV